MSPDPLADHPNQIGLSPYQYGWNNPIYWTDPDGRCPLCPWADAIIDIGFALYDVGEMIYDYSTTGKVNPVSVAAFTADMGSIFIPMSTGAGLAVRAGFQVTETATKTTAKLMIKNADETIDITSKVLKQYNISKDAVRVTKGSSDKVAYIGQGMDRVKGLGQHLGAKEGDELFKMSEGASKQWDNLLKQYDQRIPDDIVKNTKGYAENQKWIKQMKSEGRTIIDIGSQSGKGKSTFYEMEKSTVYGQ
jgi:hypothetical protein